MLKSLVSASMTLATLFGIACGISLCVPADAQDDAKPKKRANPAVEQPFKLPETIKLTDEQTTKLEAIKKEATPKLEAAAKKVEDVYTKEQKKARKSANDTAKAAGKKGKELKAAVEEALAVTPEQKETLAKAEKELADVQKSTRDQVVALLTDDQKKDLPTQGKKKKAKAAA